jgi:hypothetical protein
MVLIYFILFTIVINVIASLLERKKSDVKLNVFSFTINSYCLILFL